MTGEERKQLLETLERYGGNRKQRLKELGIPESTYYHWKRIYLEGGPLALDKNKPTARRIWNRLTETEERFVLETAKAHPADLQTGASSPFG